MRLAAGLWLSVIWLGKPKCFVEEKKNAYFILIRLSTIKSSRSSATFFSPWTRLYILLHKSNSRVKPRTRTAVPIIDFISPRPPILSPS